MSTQDLVSIVQEVTAILNEGYCGLQEHQHGTPTLEYLEGVAKVRYSLSVVAEVLKEDLKGHYFVELLKAAAKMCCDPEVNCIDPAERENTMGPLIYLLKLIVRQYGMPCLRVAAYVHDWLIPAWLRTKHVSNGNNCNSNYYCRKCKINVHIKCIGEINGSICYL